MGIRRFARWWGHWRLVQMPDFEDEDDDEDVR